VIVDSRAERDVTTRNASRCTPEVVSSLATPSAEWATSRMCADCRVAPWLNRRSTSETAVAVERGRRDRRERHLAPSPETKMLYGTKIYSEKNSHPMRSDPAVYLRQLGPHMLIE